jgi:hypothetical protein
MYPERGRTTLTCSSAWLVDRIYAAISTLLVTLHTREVAASNPAAPMTRTPLFERGFLFGALRSAFGRLRADITPARRAVPRIACVRPVDLAVYNRSLLDGSRVEKRPAVS